MIFAFISDILIDLLPNLDIMLQSTAAENDRLFPFIRYVSSDYRHTEL